MTTPSPAAGSTGATAVRVMLVDDHSLVRAGLRSLLEEIDGVEVVAEAGAGREALRMLLDLDVDVLLVDVALPELNGLEVCREVVAEHPGTAVLMCSMYADEAYVARALHHGARGYLLKDATAAELEEAVRAARRGAIYWSPQVPRRAVEELLRREEGQAGPLERLTPRQREILQLVAEGRTSKEIAAHLHLSLKTVENHRGRIMDRLDIHDLAGLVRFAVDHDLVRSPDRLRDG